MATHPFIGRTVGNYVLRRLIDQGGVGLVFVAEHRYLGEQAAIKVLHGEIDLANTDMARRFFQEAKATRAIDHPNVVRIVDFGEDAHDKLLYLVMELLEGESVAAALERGPIAEHRVAHIGASVASGLQAAHDKGIIHRDLKPGNIFLCKNGVVKLLDFGMAKMSAGMQTAVGIVVGTPQYMAPEQVQQGRKVGPTTDIYGLGAVLFRMLTARLPFIANNMGDLIRQHLTEAPPPPSRFVPVSKEMEALVLQCLEKNPARRPQSMRELAGRLRQLSERSAPQRLGGEDQTVIEAAPPAHLLAMLAREAGGEPSRTLQDEPAPSIELSISSVVEEQPAPRMTPGARAAVPAPRATPSPQPVARMTPAQQPVVVAPVPVPPTGSGPVARISGQQPVARISGQMPVARTSGIRPAPTTQPSPVQAGPRRSSAWVVAPLIVLLGVAAGAGYWLLKEWEKRPVEVTATPLGPSLKEPPAAAPEPAPPPPAPAPAAAPADVPAAAPAEVEVQIESDPPGAKVFVDHAPRGLTPLTLSLKLPSEIKLTHDGYQALRKTVKRPGLLKLSLAPVEEAAPAAAPDEP